VNPRNGMDILEEKKYLPSIGIQTPDLPAHHLSATPTTVNLKKR
jgi:hypothetical protein